MQVGHVCQLEREVVVGQQEVGTYVGGDVC